MHCCILSGRYETAVLRLSILAALNEMATTSTSSSGSNSQAPSRSSMQASQSSSSTASGQSQNSNGKPADYVYFERTTAGFSNDAVPRAKAAQLKLEHFYKVAVDSAIERNQR